MAALVFSTIDYDLFTPPRIVFGWGRRIEAGGLAASLGRRAFLVAGSRTLAKSGLIAEIEANLKQQGVDVVPLATISQEPEVSDVDDAVRSLLQFDVRTGAEGDLILAVGGGSAIDLAKAVSALATNRQGESVVDFLEGVGRGLKIENTPLPLMAMPTTAGT
ncbi:MAG: iron-containing alcohol dehydrogenase, partial [Planctomycetes bacterium]|nr:iron-containing alcohol dehydrogenase [Planctomycetota bacterium]